MRYYLPDLLTPRKLPPQSSPEDKLGGVPWGLLPSAWPVCKDCHKSQSLLAQFVHDPIRLDLGRTGRVLSVFQCHHDPGYCQTWEGGWGANACFVTEPEDLVGGLSPIPSDSPKVGHEYRICAWAENDDGIDEAQAKHFYGRSEYNPDRKNVSAGSRLGGVPYWIQGQTDAPEGGWRFLGQLDCTDHEGPSFGGDGMAYFFLRETATVPEGWFFWQCG